MKLLDVVALTEDLPEKGLTKGQVGTIVEQLAPDVFEIEFGGLDGKMACKRRFTCMSNARILGAAPGFLW